MKDKAKETVSAAADTVTAAAGEIRHLGDYIREQRAGSGVSLRQLAKTAGVSNPYLSQIERGLRKPSAEILQQIAKALRISAEALYVQAGFLEQRIGSGAVVDAVLGDEGLNERQKQVLLEIYESFRREDVTTATADAAIVSVVTAEASDEDVLRADEDVLLAAAAGQAGAAEPAAPRTTTPARTARTSQARTKPARPGTSTPRKTARTSTAGTGPAKPRGTAVDPTA